MDKPERTIAEGADDPGEPQGWVWPDRLKIALDWARWTGTIGGPLLYVLGRLMADTFFRRFGVTPEEVGLTYGSLVLPAAMLTAVAVAAVIALIMLGQLARIVGGGALFWVAWWFLFDSTRSLRDVRHAAIAVLIIGLLWLLGSLHDEQTSQAAFATTAAGLLIALVAGAWYVADRAADRAMNGEPAAVRFGPIELTNASARLVRLEGLTGGPLMREGCVLLLGSSDGVELVVVDGITWRVPSELVSTTSGVCGPADALPEAVDLPPGWSVTSRRVEAHVEPAERLWFCGVQPAGAVVATITAASSGEGDAARFLVVGVERLEDSTDAVRGQPVQAVQEMLDECPRGWTQPAEPGATLRVADPTEMVIDLAAEVDELVAWRWTATSVRQDALPVTSQHITALLVRGDVVVQIGLFGRRLDPAEATAIIEVVGARLSSLATGD